VTAPLLKAFSLEAIRQGKREAHRKAQPDVPWNDHIKEILVVVAAEFGLTYGDFVSVLGRMPTKMVGRARDEAILRAQERYGYSSTELGARFGLDHTTVLGALKRARKRREVRGT